MFPMMLIAYPFYISHILNPFVASWFTQFSRYEMHLSIICELKDLQNIFRVLKYCRKELAYHISTSFTGRNSISINGSTAKKDVEASLVRMIILFTRIIIILYFFFFSRCRVQHINTRLQTLRYYPHEDQLSHMHPPEYYMKLCLVRIPCAA